MNMLIFIFHGWSGVGLYRSDWKTNLVCVCVCVYVCFNVDGRNLFQMPCLLRYPLCRMWSERWWWLDRLELEIGSWLVWIILLYVLSVLSTSVGEGFFSLSTVPLSGWQTVKLHSRPARPVAQPHCAALSSCISNCSVNEGLRSDFSCLEGTDWLYLFYEISCWRKALISLV